MRALEACRGLVQTGEAERRLSDVRAVEFGQWVGNTARGQPVGIVLATCAEYCMPVRRCDAEVVHAYGRWEHSVPGVLQAAEFRWIRYVEMNALSTSMYTRIGAGCAHHPDSALKPR